jgi:RNA polymerase sigma factor (sigma-70 family)
MDAKLDSALRDPDVRRKLVALARHYLGFHHHYAEDAVQEGLISGFVYSEKFNGGDEVAWLWVITRNCCCSFLRRSGLFTDTLDQSFFNSIPLDRPNQAEIEIELAEASGLIDKLVGAQRSSLELWMLEYEYEEIAEIEKVPLGTVKSRIWRARDELTKMMEGV